MSIKPVLSSKELLDKYRSGIDLYAIPDTHRVVSVADLECVADELEDAGWYTRAEQLRAIIDNKEQQ